MFNKIFSDDSDNHQAIGDYSVQPASFSVNGPAGKMASLTDVTICLCSRDGHVMTYGGRMLDNGIVFKLNGVEFGFDPITSLSVLRMYGGVVDIMDNHIQIRLPIKLTLTGADTLSVVLNDDFSYLDMHTFSVNGEIQ